MIRKVSAEDIAIRGNGTGLEYMCPTWHFVYIFFNPVFQVSTAKNEINLFNNHILIVAPLTFAPAGAMTPSAEFLFFNIIYTFLFGYNTVTNTVYAMDPNNSVIKRLWCICLISPWKHCGYSLAVPCRTLLSTNIYFCGEIRKICIWYTLLSRALYIVLIWSSTVQSTLYGHV